MENIWPSLTTLTSFGYDYTKPGATSRTPTREVRRLIDTYGGNAEDWVKLSSPRYTFPDGTQMEIYWYKNLTIGENVAYTAKLLGAGIQPMGTDD